MADDPGERPNAPDRQHGAGWFIAAVAAAVLIGIFVLPGLFFSVDSADEISLGQVLTDAAAGEVLRIDVDGRDLTVVYRSPDELTGTVTRHATIGENTDLESLLLDVGVSISGDEGEGPAVEVRYVEGGSMLDSIFTVAVNLLPFALIGVFAVLIIRGMRQMGSQTASFGRSQARRFQSTGTGVTLEDVAGIDEAREELRELVEFLSTPDQFRALGARIPKGVLIVGPPGTGKTLLARAVAGEAKVPFFTISGSEFVEMFVGVGASRVRDLFNEAKQHTPCIVFIDEIDAVGRQRGYGPGMAHEEREQTLNQILVEMDGFEPDTNVIVVAATNRPDILDPALLRPGRFDRKIVLDLPDVKGREAILRVHLRGKPLEEDVDVESLARATAGFSGADLANLANEGAILAVRRGRSRIAMTDFDESIDRVMLGPERRSRVMSADERRLTAYHESGHVVVGHFMLHHDRPQKVSIVARGAAGGYTKFLPEEETRYRTASMLRDRMCAALGGYAAEEIVFGEPSTGAASDLEEVTEIARRMVMRWGMSADLGARTFGHGNEYAWARETDGPSGYSDEAAIAIDREVRKLSDEAMARARQVLEGHRELLDKMVHELLEHETLQGEDLERLLRDDGADEPGLAIEPMAEPATTPAA